MKDKNKQLGLISRPPIIVVLGHVDHGKTSLLDYIKKTKIAEKESGGITQHIGAYEIEIKDKKITFIDTPGHEAFSKIDKEGINLEKVKNELSEAGVLLEGRGGDIPFVGVSSKTGQGIDELLELILLLSEMQELKADPSNQAIGFVIESHLDRSRGNTASLIITDGTLHLKDEIIVDQMKIGKVKILENFKGESISEATFSSPVRVLGFETSVPVGAKLSAGALKDKTMASAQESKTIGKELGSHDSKIKIPLIIKSDASGSGEALEPVSYTHLTLPTI